jgi:hypothetical protein
MLKKVTPTKSEAKTLASVRRVGSQEGAEMRKMGMKRGGMAKKRYAEGGMASAGLDLEAKARRGEMERELGKMDFSTPKVEAPAKKESFSAAFAAARKRGDKTFTWKGGSYGTKMKGDGDKPTKANKPSTPTPTPTPTATPSKPAPAASAASAAPAKPASGPPRTAFSMRNETPEFKAEASRRTKLRTIRGPAKPKTKETETKTPASNAARTDFDTKAGRAGIGIMLERPPRSLKYAKGGSVTRGDGAIRKGKTKGRII